MGLLDETYLGSQTHSLWSLLTATATQVKPHRSSKDRSFRLGTKNLICMFTFIIIATTFLGRYQSTLEHSFSSRFNSTVNDHSVINVKIFDASKFDRRQDLGFLGVMNVRVAELDLSNHSMSSSPSTLHPFPVESYFNPWGALYQRFNHWTS
jgi:hypothetical protein